MMPQPTPPQQPPMPDQLALQGITLAHQMVGQQMSELMQMFEQANQVVQSKTPPPPVDPAVEKTFEAAMAEIQRKADESKARLEFDQKKAMSEDMFLRAQEENAMKLAAFQEENKKMLALQQEESRKQIAVIQEAGKQGVEKLRQQIEIQKNEADNYQHQVTELLKNRDDNQTKVLVEQLKRELAPMQQAAPMQDDGMLREMQRLLGELKDAKTNGALEAVVQGLQAVIGGQQQHQERMLQAASQLMRSE